MPSAEYWLTVDFLFSCAEIYEYFFLSVLSGFSPSSGWGCFSFLYQRLFSVSPRLRGGLWVFGCGSAALRESA
jgi:hypothetical protein